VPTCPDCNAPLEYATSKAGGRYLVDAIGLNRVTGRPFKISEIETKIRELVRQKVRIG